MNRLFRVFANVETWIWLNRRLVACCVIYSLEKLEDRFRQPGNLRASLYTTT